VLGPAGEVTRAIQARFVETIQGKRQEYLEWLDFVDLDVPAAESDGRAPPSKPAEKMPS